MNNRKMIFAGVIAVLFLVAGYNLWSYFKEQQAIQNAEDKARLELKIARQKEREQRKAEKAERIRQQQLAEKAEEEAYKAEVKKKKEEKQAKLDAQKKAYEEETRQREEKRKNDRTLKARTVQHIEGMSDEIVAKFNQLSADYIRNNPQEFLNQRFNEKSFGAYKPFVKLMTDNTNSLMIFCAVSHDIDIIKALVDIGIDINASNKSGYTALMFASAYNKPEVVRYLLGQGADIKARAHVLDMNALHVSSLLNPLPDTSEVLVRAGIPLEQETENDYTPLLIAITENPNLEVAEKLAELGANTKAYDENGIAVYNLAKKRINGEGRQYISISDTVNERILKKMR
jgi:hypothetical protein